MEIFLIILFGIIAIMAYHIIESKRNRNDISDNVDFETDYDADNKDKIDD